ncbi:MAG: hypothetical protein ACOYMA_06065 [Bacteroidia bacterium]
MIILKQFILTILCLFIAGTAIAQTENQKLLMSDSAGIALEKALKNIDIKYGFEFGSLPDSVAKNYDKLSNIYLRRNFLIEKYNKEAEIKIWISKTDSLINLNKTDFKGTGNIGFGISSNQGMFSAQYAFVFSKYRQFDFGIGSGIEYLNRSGGLVQVIQSPVFITNKYFVSRGTFLNLDYGLTIPLSATYKNQNDATIDLKESELKSNYILNFGVGFMTKKDEYFQINFRNNSLGVPEPLNQRVWMFGVKYGF